MIALLLGTAFATRFEAEAVSTYRIQQAGAFVEEGLYAYVPTEGLTSGGRLRLESDDAHLGVEMFGNVDKVAVVDGRRPQRWGGARALFGVRGRTPIYTTLTHFRAGVVAWDVRDIAEDEHQPMHLATLGIEVRRFGRRRFQSVEGELMSSTTMIAGELRSRAGYGVRDTGLYFTLGAATSRFQAYQGTARQVTYQIETSVLWRPGNGR
ncbi:MAG: hypothetical protein H6737_07710 [Alphaproteobacteria bacterium]|nr:hypothetical protein [Alphaproteobacteria bacterium]